MAKEETQEKKMTAGFEGLGKFREDTGGGEPIPKGQKMTNQKRVLQPRDENGQFTYNAANKRKLKYGPSRGKTTPPYLRIHSDETKESGKYVIDGKVYNVNSYVVSDTVQNQMMANFKNNAKEYIGKELYHKTGEVNRISKMGNPYTLILSALNDGVTIDPKDKSDFGDLSDKSIGTETKAVKTGKKSNVEKAAIVSGYTGDLNKLQYTGTSEELKQPWADYTKNKKSSPFFASKLSPKNPKPQAAPAAPEQPKSAPAQPAPAQPAPKDAQPKQGTTFNDEDKKLASENGGMGFVSKYASELNDLEDFAKNHGWVGIDMDAIVSAIADGEISGFDEAKKMIEEAVA